jgi:hypothetical protein
MTPDDSPLRRRRRRPSPETSTVGTAGAAPVPSAPAASNAGPPPAARAESAKPRRKRPAGDAGERGLRDIVGAGPSQVGVSGALRGRDVNRPTDEDIAAAERDLVIVRRSRPDGVS